jgi:hypothetical protein
LGGKKKNERNSLRTQWYPIHQRRPNKNVGLGNGNSRRRSMINTPEPRLEPDHRFDDEGFDESDTDFIQTDFNDDDVDLTPYYWEEGELKDLVKREPQCHIV